MSTFDPPEKIEPTNSAISVDAKPEKAEPEPLSSECDEYVQQKPQSASKINPEEEQKANASKVEPS